MGGITAKFSTGYGATLLFTNGCWTNSIGPQLLEHLVFAIINLTPDSFYDAGIYFSGSRSTNNPAAVSIIMAHIRKIIQAGVPVIDLGAESTRPGADPVPQEEEWVRLEAIIKATVELRDSLACAAAPSSFGISVDTYKAKTAERAILLGADIINDISAFEYDKDMKSVLAEHRPGYVLMHSGGRSKFMQSNPHYNNVTSQVLDFLSSKMDELLATGFPAENILIDPGIGFGKTLEHNLQLLRNIHRFKELGRPILIGLSNKSMFGDLLGLGPLERKEATLVATAILAARGVWAHRVHDPLEALKTLELAQALTP